jgi:carbonic anhydrase
MGPVYRQPRINARVQREVIAASEVAARIMPTMTSSAELVRQARNQGVTIPKKPRRRTAVVTCMDTRLDPLRIVSAEVGDIHVIRNAGAVVTDDVVRSLIASTRWLGVDRIQIMMHTDCGALGLTRDVVEAELGPAAPDLRGFTSIEDELERGVERLRSEPLIGAAKGVTGMIYDVATGELRTVIP